MDNVPGLLSTRNHNPNQRSLSMNDQYYNLFLEQQARRAKADAEYYRILPFVNDLASSDPDVAAKANAEVSRYLERQDAR